jgi:hypothetical protein
MQNKELMPLLCAFFTVVVITFAVVLNNPQTLTAYQLKYEIPRGEIYGDTTSGQTFFDNENGLERIDILLATYARNNAGSVTFHLRENGEKSDIRTIIFDANDVLDNQYYSFTFTPIEDSKNKSYEFYLESPSASSGNAITMWYNKTNSYDLGNATLNGNTLVGDMAFKVFNKNKNNLLISEFFRRFTQDFLFFVGYSFIVLIVLSLLIIHTRSQK